MNMTIGKKLPTLLEAMHARVLTATSAWGHRAAIVRTVVFLPLVLNPSLSRCETSVADTVPRFPPIADLTGNWQFVPIPLPERDVTHIHVSNKKDKLWLGTSGGVASYDGVAVRVPVFESADAEQQIHVNSLVELEDNTVLVGTINDSLWKWKGDRISAIYGACARSESMCPRGDWSFAKSANGTLFAASSSIGSRNVDALDALRAVVNERIVSVRVPASYLGFAGEELIATSERGGISIIDRVSGNPLRRIDLELDSNNFVRNVSYADGTIFVGTDKQCLKVVLTNTASPITKMADGNCTSVYAQRDGTTWLSTDDLYRHDAQGWKRWAPSRVGVVRATSIAEDGMANVWVGTPFGLWRYFDLSRDFAFHGPGSQVASLVPDANGGVVVGLANGEVWRLNRKLETARIAIPSSAQSPTSPYYRGALLTVGNTGKLWMLNAAGLFKIDGANAIRIAEYPVSLKDSSTTPSSLAVSGQEKVCVGLLWKSNTLCLIDGTWKVSAEVLGDIGGSAVAALTFSRDGSMLSVGVKSISVVGITEEELGPFEPAHFGKKHLFGAIATTSLVKGADVVASGGWGGTVFLTHTAKSFSKVEQGMPTGADQPYLIRQFSPHPNLGLLAGADEGLFVWEGKASDGQWKSLRDVDPRFSNVIDGVVPSTGRALWVASGQLLSLIDLPTASPRASIERSPVGEAISTNAIAYKVSIPGLVGLPSAKTAAISYDPPIINAERNVKGPKGRVDLTDLSDLTTYKLATTVTDGFLNRGETTVDRFSVELPFYRNPYKLSLAVMAAVLLLGLLLTRRGPTGFILQRLGGLRWSTGNSDARFAIEVKAVGEDIVRFELEAPSELTLIRLQVDVPTQQLECAPKEVLPALIQRAETEVCSAHDDFETAVTRAGEVLGQLALPQNLRFTTSQYSSGAISLDLSKSLLWLPFELADDGGGAPLLLRYAIGRTVSGDVLAERKRLRTPRLKVVVFAPHVDTIVPLQHVEAEARSVAAAAQSWGAKVHLLRPDATKQEVLEALCDSHLFHYAGHAEFLPDASGQSYLPIRGGRILATDVATALETRSHSLLLAFINGCGSSREASWDRGAEVYGFASAFLNNAACFIGTQWPIHDEFAAAFASEFYARLFPPSYSVWWRLIRRNPLHGIPFAEALRSARQSVRGAGPAATQTWSAYIFYGDPTCQLVLE